VNLVAVLVVLAVVGVVAAVVVGAVHGGLDEPASTLPPSGLPEGDLVPEDLAAVRFSLGFRGYRMDEVDAVLDRAQAELARAQTELAGRDAELAQLRSGLSDHEQPEPAAEQPANGTRVQVRDGVGSQDEGPQTAAETRGATGAQNRTQNRTQNIVENGTENGVENGVENGAARPATGSNGVPSRAASTHRT
jgi:DivIVA domain-containing protein